MRLNDVFSLMILEDVIMLLLRETPRLINRVSPKILTHHGLIMVVCWGISGMLACSVERNIINSRRFQNAYCGAPTTNRPIWGHKLTFSCASKNQNFKFMRRAFLGWLKACREKWLQTFWSDLSKRVYEDWMKTGEWKNIVPFIKFVLKYYFHGPISREITLKVERCSLGFISWFILHHPK